MAMRTFGLLLIFATGLTSPSVARADKWYWWAAFAISASVGMLIVYIAELKKDDGH